MQTSRRLPASERRQRGDLMQPMEVLQCVRKGYALAPAERVAVMRGCVDIDVVDERWVPRWAVEAAVSLENVGYGSEQIHGLFLQGRERVLAELTALTQSGRLSR